MEDTIITLGAFHNSIDAYLYKTKLESEGIYCMLSDENIVSLNPAEAIAYGGVKLKIWSADKEKALQIIHEMENTPYTNDQNEIIRCPSCHSQEVYSGFNSIRSTKGLLNAIAALLLMIYPFKVDRKYRCKKCEYEFLSDNSKK